ncbi:MAG: class I adenylate-forming enzyme family protein [Coxiellaceae bacterium]|nr:class I adenylate-forming enzyme family protein [Coxiellaceae bacterium]
MENYPFLLQHELINTAKLHPKKIALIIDNVNITYEAFFNEVLKFSAYLVECYLSRGDRVLIQSGNSYLTVVSFFSAIFCDAVPCVLDENLPIEILEKLIQSLQPKIAIVKKNDPLKKDIFHKKNIICLDDILIGKNSFEMIFKSTEQDLVMIMHTSGSTGLPKGVMLSHRNVLSALYAIRTYLGINGSDIILSVLPLHFDYGLYQLFLPLSFGATLILEENSLFINKISHKIIHKKVTVIPCIPYLVQLLHVFSKHNKKDYHSVRMITNTGENLTSAHIEKIKHLFPKAQLFSMYGLTECKRCSYVPPSMLAEKMDSIGIPMPNLEMWIEDDEGNKLTKNNEGNLVVSGPSVMIGYWKNNEETNLKIKFSESHKKTLMTGDRAIMDEDGYFYFKGRKDSVIKFKGVKLCCQTYIKKINDIDFVNRSYLFLSDDALIVCIEIEKNHDDFFRLEILSLFPPAQKPSALYITRQFPCLSNGKLDGKALELIAKGCSE